jgi:high-affinity nickel-transport protein
MIATATATAATGLRIGLVATAFGLGFRHGIDWDHIAALTDITGSQESGRTSMVLATLYALGHALVVFVLGVLAIVASAQIPHWLDDTMGRVVGATLLALGVYVIVSFVRHGREFRMRSRWMLVFAGVRRAVRWTAQRRGGARELIVITHEHDHPAGEAHDADHTRAAVHAGASTATAIRHSHLHHHIGTLPDDPFPSYGRRTALAVGALHGIGAETPTQILLFLAAARAGGAATGVALLICFLVGLVVSNTVIALTAAFGFLSASRNFRIYATISLVTAAFSLAVGTLFLLGHASFLPALAGG